MHFVIETNANWDGRWMESSCFAFMSWKLHGVISFVILSSYPFFHIGRKAEPSKYNWGESTRHRQAFLMSLLQKYYLSIGLYVNQEEKNENLYPSCMTYFVFICPCDKNNWMIFFHFDYKMVYENFHMVTEN